MDYSAAQLNGRAEEYADALVSRIPGFTSLSPEAQKVEHAQCVLEAQNTAKGCKTHFNGSVLRIQRNERLVPSEKRELFQHFINTLTSEDTLEQQFGDAVRELRSNFPGIEGWLSWWLRPANAQMIFPVKRRMDRTLADETPNTTNGVESQHSLLHRAHWQGVDQDLITGIKKLHLFIEKTHTEYLAIKGILSFRGCCI